MHNRNCCLKFLILKTLYIFNQKILYIKMFTLQSIPRYTYLENKDNYVFILNAVKNKNIKEVINKFGIVYIIDYIISINNLEILQTLIMDFDADKLYILYEAVRIQNMDVIKYIKNKTYIHKNDTKLLDLVVNTSNLEIIKYFLDIFTVDKLFISIIDKQYNKYNKEMEENNWKIIRYLVSLSPSDEAKTSATSIAIRNGDIFNIDQLVKLIGAHIDSKDNILIFDNGGKSLELIKYLVYLGLNVNVYEDLALQIAAINNDIHTIKYLIENHNMNLYTNNYWVLRWIQQNKNKGDKEAEESNENKTYNYNNDGDEGDEGDEGDIVSYLKNIMLISH